MIKFNSKHSTNCPYSVSNYNYQKILSWEKEPISFLEPTKSAKIVAADFIRKKEKSFSMS